MFRHAADRHRDGQTWLIPRCAPGDRLYQVRAGEKHSLRNLGDDDMFVLTIYDPPRTTASLGWRPRMTAIHPTRPFLSVTRKDR
jgi:hypothetical protein